MVNSQAKRQCRGCACLYELGGSSTSHPNETKIRAQQQGYCFQIQCDISKILRSWLPVMSATLKPLIKWPSKHAILKNMPKCFKTKYKRCRCIIDCSEISIDRPTNLTSRAQTYSTYKSHNTVKYLVGMSPAGAITFLSAGWGGHVSDKQITAESGFYDLLEHNDEILADRGFTIRDELATCGATLRIPHFTKGRKQLTAQEVDTSRRLSNVRIHIERVIGRCKKFQNSDNCYSTHTG